METILRFLVILSSCGLLAHCHTHSPDPAKPVPNGVVHLNISGSTETYHLKLTKPDVSILHPNVQIITVEEWDENEIDNQSQVPLDTWTPTKTDIEATQDIYIDHENLAAVRLTWDDERGQHVVVTGVVDGKRVTGGSIETGVNSDAKVDYVDIGRNLTMPRSLVVTATTPLVVELVIVCDKEFGDVFNHDRQKILDYFTVYFWDVNMRYKTLKSSNISFRINAIIVIRTPSGQPFIEESRAADGRSEFGRMLPLFASWIYGQMATLPKFDLAVAFTNAEQEWKGGRAYVRGTCLVDHTGKRHFGTGVLNDKGDWNSVKVAAHEFGHNLGAHHDNEAISACEERGYIMMSGNAEIPWYFSSCSDRQIAEFVRSNQAVCLRRLDETTQAPIISPDYSGVLPPSMEEQCRRRLNNAEAFMKEVDKANCKELKCWVPNGEYRWLIWTLPPPVDNSPCTDGGRCLRGVCQK